MKHYNEYYKINKFLDRFLDEPNQTEITVSKFIERIEKQVNICTLQLQRMEMESMKWSTPKKHTLHNLSKSALLLYYILLT